MFEEFAQRQAGDARRFPLIPYADALRNYGTDKPDLRNPIKMQDVSEAFRGSGFKIFANISRAIRRRGVGHSGAEAAATAHSATA